MANDLYGTLFSNVHHDSGETYHAPAQDRESFLRDVVTPIYEFLLKESRRNKGGKTSHTAWRNYDGLNDYFWNTKCFKLGWPIDRKADFFVHSDVVKPANQILRKRKPKTNFVEVRTFWHLYRSFDRMWIFFILALQAMIIIGWHQNVSSSLLFDDKVVRNVLSIFITAAVLNFLRAILDIVLSLNTWGSLKFTQILRYFLKFVIATFWLIVMPIAYSRSVENPSGIIRFFNGLGAYWQDQSLYYYCIAIYLLPNLLAALLFLFPFFQKIHGNVKYTRDYHFNVVGSAKIVYWKRNARGYNNAFKRNYQDTGKRKPKTNFVEVRTFWHLCRSFDRMWIFFILPLQKIPSHASIFLLETVTLWDRYRNSWTIKTMEIDGVSYLIDGWAEFVADCALENMDVLKFTYSGLGSFDVDICGPDGDIKEGVGYHKTIVETENDEVDTIARVSSCNSDEPSDAESKIGPVKKI